MSHRGYAHRPARAGAAIALALTAVLATGCGQVTIGEGTPSGANPGTASPGPSPTSSSSPASPDAAGEDSGGDPAATDAAGPDAGGAGATADLVPGPGAPEGCAPLVGPLHRLVTGEGDRESTSQEVRRLADGTADNALSAVARRISGLAAQPTRDVVALSAEWDQVRQLCRLP